MKLAHTYYNSLLYRFILKLFLPDHVIKGHLLAFEKAIRTHCSKLNNNFTIQGNLKADIKIAIN